MPNRQETAPSDLNQLGAFIGDTLSKVFDQGEGDFALRTYADKTAHQLGRGLLYMFSNRSRLPEDTRESLYGAMGDLFTALPEWVKFSQLQEDIVALQELPDEVRVVVEPHITDALSPGT